MLSLNCAVLPKNPGRRSGIFFVENGEWKVLQGCQSCVVGARHASPGATLAARIEYR